MERAWSPSILSALATSIRDHAGLSFVPTRYDELERRTRRAMAKAGTADVHDYAEGLGSGRFSFDDWVSELTVGETYFFREPPHFEFIRRRVVPEVRARHGAGHVFRVWSAGCASGEEAYSLAILFEEMGLSDSLHLVGTDISRVALAKAREGVYNAWSLRGSRDAWISRYFRKFPNKQFELVERVRKQVTFEYLNLALDEYPSFFTGLWGNDLILCRNVLIYLDRDTIRAVARRLFETLADGGWLITGPSDPGLSEYAPFETVVTEAGVLYLRSQNGAATASAHAAPPASEASDAAFAARDDESTDVRAISGARIPSSTTFKKAETARDAAPADAKTPAPDDSAALALAEAAFSAGQYDRAIVLARKLVDHAGAASLEVRATANLLGAREASRLCTAALLRYPLGAELYVLQASLLLDLREYEAAAHAARRILYLDRSLVVGHLLLGSILGKRGQRDEARRALRNARDLAALAPPDDKIPFTDGERAGRLADFARAQLQLLDGESNEHTRGVP